MVSGLGDLGLGFKVYGLGFRLDTVPTQQQLGDLHGYIRPLIVALFLTGPVITGAVPKV